MQKAMKDYAAQRFDRIFTLYPERIKGPTQKRTVWICICSCGKQCKVSINQLINQRKWNTRLSCGCFKKPGAIEPAWRDYLRTYQKGAKDRGYLFSLKESQFKELCSRNCYYCGEAPKEYTGYYKRQKRWAKNYSTNFDDSYYQESLIRVNGIDRIDNNQGYTESNCVACCTKCNLGKQQLTKEEFLTWAKRIVECQMTLNGG